MSILGLIDNSHASAADSLCDAVVAKNLADERVMGEGFGGHGKVLLPLTL